MAKASKGNVQSTRRLYVLTSIAQSKTEHALIPTNIKAFVEVELFEGKAEKKEQQHARFMRD